MPELPEVENVAVALRAALTGRRLDGLHVRCAKLFEPSSRAVRAAIVGRRLDGVHRHGKYLILTFGPDASPTHLMLHLRMTGQVFTTPDYRPDKHVHARFDFEDRTIWYRDLRKFGRFTLVDHPRRPSAIDHVGPDMLEAGFAEWDARCAHRRAPWKAVLLDQGVAAGLGNIYADEALFLAGIHPLDAPADTPREARKRLHRAARRVLRHSIRHGGTTFMDFVDFTGKPGRFRGMLHVFQRDGEACGRCGGGIDRIRVAGRSTHFCPVCQPPARS